MNCSFHCTALNPTIPTNTHDTAEIGVRRQCNIFRYMKYWTAKGVYYMKDEGTKTVEIKYCAYMHISFFILFYSYSYKSRSHLDLNDRIKPLKDVWEK